jgi:hypothetical protein
MDAGRSAETSNTLRYTRAGILPASKQPLGTCHGNGSREFRRPSDEIGTTRIHSQIVLEPEFT